MLLVAVLEKLQAPQSIASVIKFIFNTCHPFEHAFVSQDFLLQLSTLRTLATLITTLAKLAIASTTTTPTESGKSQTPSPASLFAALVPSIRDLCTAALAATSPLVVKVAYLTTLPTLLDAAAFVCKPASLAFW